MADTAQGSGSEHDAEKVAEDRQVPLVFPEEFRLPKKVGKGEADQASEQALSCENQVEQRDEEIEGQFDFEGPGEPHDVIVIKKSRSHEGIGQQGARGPLFSAATPDHCESDCEGDPVDRVQSEESIDCKAAHRGGPFSSQGIRDDEAADAKEGDDTDAAEIVVACDLMHPFAAR